MKSLTLKIFTFVILQGLIPGIHSQAIPKSEFYLPANFRKTKLWTKAETERSGTVMVGYYRTYPGSMDSLECFSIIRTQQDFGTFLTAKTWAIKNYTVAFPCLISLLTDTTTVGLTNTADLIIPGRNLPFYGHGGIIKEDIFRVAGRSSHILNELTGEEFAVVHPTTTMSELRDFQALWVNWIKSL